MSHEPGGGAIRVAWRELRRIAGSWYYAFLLLLLPLAGFSLIWAIFSQGVP